MINPIAVSRSRCSNLQNKLKCSNHVKDAQRDVPCINIILRSDCKMHSNRYNRLQKESTSLFQPNADSTKTNLQSSNVLQFYSFNKKYNHTAFRTENCFDMSRSVVGTHYERKYDRDNDGLTFNNISRLRYDNNQPFLCHPVRSNEISDNNIFRSNSLKTNLFSQINRTKQITPLSKNTVRSLGVDDIKANFNVSKLVECSAKFSKKFPTNSFPVTNLASSMKQINGSNGVSKMIKTDLSLNSAQISNVKENSIKLLSLPMNFKSPLENSTNLQLKSPNMLLNSEFMKLGSLVTPITDRPRTELFYASSPSASDVTRNFMKNNDIKSTICINETIGTCKDKCEEHKPKASFQKDKFDRSTLVTEKFAKFSIPQTIDIRTNVNCNEINCSMLNAKRDEYEDRFSNIRNINDYECVDKCTSTIDNALDILQNMLNSVKRFRDKDMKECNDQNYQFKEVKCKNMDCIYKSGKNKVLSAKINAAEITRPKCMKMLQEIRKHADTLEEELTSVNKSIRTKKKGNEKLVAGKSNVKQHSDMITQNPEKKNIYIQEPCSHDDIKYFQSPLLRLETNFNSQHVKRADVILSRIHKKGTYKKDHNKNDNSYERNNIKYPGDNYSTNVKNAHIQCARSVSFRIFDSSNFRPIATSTPRNIDAPKNEETLCYISTCTQTTSIYNEQSLRIKQVKKTASTELNDYSVGQENKTINSVNVNKEISSCCDEKAIIMLFLTKNLNSKCLKTKYKRSEFLNFRSKCLTGTCVICGKKKLIKYGLSRRKKRIPVAFKLMSVTYKSEAVRSNSNHRGYEKCSVNNCKVSDLLNTVYTQSSNLQITTATSVSCISVGNTNSMKNFDEERIARNDGCVLS